MDADIEPTAKPWLRIAIIEGNEGYHELARLTAWGYKLLLDRRRELHDGQGNCWVVAAIADGVARALGLRSQLCGGKVFNDRNELMYGGRHYWTVVDGVIVDSPATDLLMVGTAAQRASLRYVPVARYMREARGRGLRALSDSTRERMLTDPPPAGIPPAP